MVLAAAVWSFVLLHRDPGWHPAVRFAVLVIGVPAALALALPVRVGGDPATTLAEFTT